MIANEWRAYQEALVKVLAHSRPEAEILPADWMTFESSVLEEQPGVVISDCITPLVESLVPVWIELQGSGDSTSRVSFDGEVEVVENIQIQDILDVLDRADDLFVGFPETGRNIELG